MLDDVRPDRGSSDQFCQGAVCGSDCNGGNGTNLFSPLYAVCPITGSDGGITQTCTNLASNNSNCGACGNACPSGSTCSSEGQCSCQTDAGYTQVGNSCLPGGSTPLVALSPTTPNTWVASCYSANGTCLTPAYAIDGTVCTRFTSQAPQAIGDYLELDLGSPVTSARSPWTGTRTRAITR